MTTLRLGFSPCPNDTFIFGALATGRLNVPNWTLKVTLEDVETLNNLAKEGVLELTKISVHAFALVTEQYGLLRSGAALGRGCGPLVVAPEPKNMDSLRGEVIAIPGELTTANLLLQLYGEGFSRVVPMGYETIMPRLQRGEFAAGVIIHEGRFTYQDHGLHLVLDLGGWWEETQNLPLPLGAILIRRDLGPDVAQIIEDAIRHSMLFARRQPDEVWSYVKMHAQEMDDSVIRQHIDLYVNDYSLDLGEDGTRAIVKLLELAHEHELVPPLSAPLFLDG
ncbi:MAG: 1,4-dihydroxy-6-naphthoate synthase [Deltaproteobacteria bacterium]|jgi:1,4-dihydroxy-6-naphthoate synthase|nr:MAG: 1,4-dihydroxy-6-naphthoate synthase [Deltaproteobacteria bacterium]